MHGENVGKTFKVLRTTLNLATLQTGYTDGIKFMTLKKGFVFKLDEHLPENRIYEVYARKNSVLPFITTHPEFYLNDDNFDMYVESGSFEEIIMPLEKDLSNSRLADID